MLVGRTVAIALGLLLAAAPVAQAEGPASAPRPRVGKVGLRIEQIFPDTHQALVLDKDTGRHLVVGEGERIGKYEITEIEDDQVVVMVGAREVVLMVDGATPATAAPAPALPPASAPKSELLDPYAAAPSVVIDSGGLLDPYAPMMSPPPVTMGATVGTIDPRTPVREVLAPPEQRASTSAPVDPYSAPTVPVTTAPAPATAAPAKPATAPAPTTATPAPSAPAPVKTDAAPPEALRIDAMNLQRADLTAALADFDKLSQDLGFARLGTGVRLARVPATSYFYRLGFRAGDVVTAIDGAPIRTLDDAAGVYVRLGSAKKLAVEVDRGGAHGTLKFNLK